MAALAAPLALDSVEIMGVDIAGDVATIEAGGIENRQVTAQGGDRLLERFDILINQCVSADFGDWRFNLRASNTEPVMRLNVEARGKPSLVTRGVEMIRPLLV